jgi:hypothetical protein
MVESSLQKDTLKKGVSAVEQVVDIVHLNHYTKREIKHFVVGKIAKKIREQVYEKCGGHCGYCGCEITYKQMQVDHIKPLYRNDDVKTLEVWGVERGTDDFDNLMPTCARCNRWKSTFSLEMFREEISKQLERVNRDSAGYRLAKDFGLIEENKINVVFYFEK